MPPITTRLAGLGLLAACATPTTGPTSAAPPGGAPVSTVTSFSEAAAPAALVAASTGATLIADEGPPISLTASDGTGLELTRMEAKAVIEGPLAYTELHLRFQNPNDRTLEGRFAITLPDGAALSRFAMMQDRGWMEAEVVERMAARRAYEDFLHRRQDPALLENEAGNEFSARVFPIPARGTKDLIVSFSHEVHGTYTLPLRGLPQIGEIKASVRVARPDRTGPMYDETTLVQAAWKPDRDLAVALGAAPRSIRAGELVAAVIDPLADVAPAAMPGLTILFDTSASRAPGYAGQVENLMATIGELGRIHGAALPITVAAFDQSVEELYRGGAGSASGLRDKLLQRRALGASDTTGALRWLAAHGGARRAVIVGDAVSTVGDDAALNAALAGLKGKLDRLDVVLVGGIRDRDAAARLTRGGLRDDGAILDGAKGPGEVARRLGLATRSGLKVKIDGARWVWPETLDGVQPGDETVVIAALDRDVATRVTVQAGDVMSTVAPAIVPRPLLARAAAGAEIARLESARTAETDAAKRSAMAKQIVGLSTRHRVLSDMTALLVLESESDYARFGIPRTALTDILVVGTGGLVLEHRTDAVLIAKPPERISALESGKMGKKLDEKSKQKEESEGQMADGDGIDDGKDFEADKNMPGEMLRQAPSPSSPPADMSPRPARRPPPAPRARGGRGSGGGGDAVAADEYSGRVPTGRAHGAALGAAAGSTADGNGVAWSVDMPSPPPPEPPPASGALALERRPDPVTEEPKKAGPPPLEGELGAVMALIAAGDTDAALKRALAWRDRDAGDVLALVALGEALEAKQMPALAARAYGSIIDLFPSRADLRRFAGERLERLGDTSRALASDTYRLAVESRPDHLTGHRLLAWSLVRQGDLPGAFAALERGLTQQYPGDRFRGGTRILSEDLGIVAAAWIAKAPRERASIEARVAKAGAKVSRNESLRFVLYWETDANDVDFHIRDARGGHAYYQAKALRSGGELYEDVTTGYGPECFTIPGGGRAAPYDLQIHYYSRGPMGYGMGMLEIVRHDGKGNLGFEHRPYIVMIDGAYVELGTVDAKTAAIKGGGGAAIAN